MRHFFETFKNAQSAYAARKRGIAPPFMKIEGRGIVYEKQAIIEFVKNLKKKTVITLFEQVALKEAKRLWMETDRVYKDWKDYIFLVPRNQKILEIMKRNHPDFGDVIYVLTEDRYYELVACKSCKKRLPSSKFRISRGPCIECQYKREQTIKKRQKQAIKLNLNKLSDKYFEANHEEDEDVYDSGDSDSEGESSVLQTREMD